MRLERLDVARMPGLDARLALEGCAPGLNLVWGPNEAGKTSLCRAVRALLWEAEDFRGEAEALWSDGARVWTAARETAVAPRWTSADGAEPPLVPDARFRRCFTIGADELFSDRSETDDEIRAEVRRELAAGYDLAAIARDAGGAKAGARGVRDRLRALDAARRERGRLQGEQRRLREREQRSEELERDWRDADAARGELRLFADLRALRALRGELERLEERRRVGFPDGMERLDGKELERLAEVAARLREARAAAGAAEGELGRRVANAEETGLVGDESVEQDLATLDRRLQGLEESERAAEEARRELARAGGALDEADGRGVPDDDPDPERLAAAERLVRERARATERAEALAARRAALPEVALEGPDADALRDGRRALLAWLADVDTGAGASAADRLGPWPTLALLALAAALVLLGAPLVALAPLGLAAAWELWRGLAGRGAARGSERGRRRADYQALGLAAPDAWEHDAVRARLEELDRALVERLAAEGTAAERARLAGEHGRAARQERELAERADAALAALGLGPLDGALATGELLTRVQAAAGARARLAEARGLLDAHEGGLAERREGCLEVLERHGAPPRGADLAALRAARDGLARRLATLQTAVAERGTFADKLDDARRAERRALEERDRLLAAAGLPPEGEQELRRRLERLEEWRALDELVRERTTEAGVRARELAEHGALLELPDAELAARQEERERRAARVEELAAARAELKLELESARRGHDLEAALAAERDALDALAEQRRQVLRSEALELLLESVDAEHRERSRPDLLRRASELFSRFTRERYELRPAPGLASGDEGFRIATREGGARTLEQLSSGTRAQLLLALRLAVAERAERGTAPVPLFVDEALTNSDPERFHQIALALCELARAGRQVFLLTSDDADLARARRAAEQAGIGAPREFDLAALRGAAAAPDERVFELTPLPAVPAPAGASAAEYARRLRVPEPDPFAGVDALHPLYLFLHVWAREADELHELLRLRGADTVGRARALLAREGARLPDAARRRFEVRRRVAQAFLDAWRVGRARPLTAGDLREGPLARSKFLEAVIELEERHGGDARALLAALEDGSDERPARFQSRLLDELREDLRERELWSPEAPLDEAGCAERALAACEPLVAAGRVEREEVHQLCHALWQVLSGEAEGARS